MNILQAMADERLFGPHFRPIESWALGRVFLAGLFGLGTDASPEHHELWKANTGTDRVPTKPAREGWLIAGRRGGKSRLAALCACFCAAFRDYSQVLAPGERGTVMLIAADRRQARVLMRYVKGMLKATPTLAATIERETAESVDLTNRVTIEVHTASFRSTRGYTVVAAIAGELAFWDVDEDSAEPDREVLAAMRPGMATVPGALMLAISSPYARKGELWRAYERHFGKEGDVVVFVATTRELNPNVSPAVIEAAMVEDESSALAEYGAQFRRDVESFVSRETVEAATIADRAELPPALSTHRYVAFADPAGGSGQDSMTLGIAHAEGERVVLDVLREVRPPFSPDMVCRDFAAVLRMYGVTEITSDRYAGSWPSERLAKHGIRCKPSDLVKSEIYAALLPLLNSGRVELLDDARLKRQLLGLERRTARSGKDSIDHGPRGHDDVVNSAGGALVLAAKPAPRGAFMTHSLTGECLEPRTGRRLPPVRIDPRTGYPLIDMLTGWPLEQVPK